MKTKIMERVDWIDIAKGIGIICVMLGHLGIEKIDRIVFTFHMPLFFLISGYFLKTNLILKEFVKEKGKRLLMPYYITGGIISLLLVLADIFRQMWNRIIPDLWSTFVAVLYGSSFKVCEGIEGIGAIWFLWALFWASIIVKIMSVYKYGLVYICIFAVISCISSRYFWLPLGIQPGMCASIFVWLGSKFKEVDLNESLKNKYLVLASLGIFVLEIVLGIRVDMANNTYVYGFISVIGAVVICYFVIYIANLIGMTNSKIKAYLKIVGKYSLYLLCIHQIEMRVFPWSIVKLLLEKFSLGNWFYLAVICIRIAGCSLCMMFFVRIKREISIRRESI